MSSSSDAISAQQLAEERGRADLVLGNNVLAQVPDINDFIAGVARLLGPEGTATFEFPHLAKLIEHLEYDTIYHEHFSYFSLHAIRAIFGVQGLDARGRRGVAQSRWLAPRLPAACGGRRRAVGGCRPVARTGG